MLPQPESEPPSFSDDTFLSSIFPAQGSPQPVYELHPPRRGLSIGSEQLYPLTIDSKGLFERFARSQSDLGNDLGFANNFIWMSRMSGFYAIIEDCFCLFSLQGGVLNMLLPPLGDTTRQLSVLQRCFQIMNTYNESASHSAVAFVDSETALRLSAEATRWQLTPHHADYVYATRDLIELSGNAYKNKRNEVNQFLRAYPIHSLVPLAEEHHEQILALFGYWVGERLRTLDASVLTDFIESVELERQGIEQALRHYDALELEGLCLFVDGKLEGFTFGERINGKVGSVLVEKTNFAIAGAAQFLFREFCRHLAECDYINVGDDLGLENMRRVKMSYRPLLQVKKFHLHYVLD